MSSIKILLADDHRLFRSGMKQLLDQRTGLEVIGEACNGFVATELAIKLRPDLIFMDISMPELNGIAATRRILEENPKARIVILSMHSDLRYVTESLKAGARGYLLKDASPEELVRSVSQVMAGRYFLSTGVDQKVIEDFIKLQTAGSGESFSILSSRENEVLQLIAEGVSTKSIGEKLNLSVKTVESHRLHIMEKLNIHNVAELTRYAIREGIVTP